MDESIQSKGIVHIGVVDIPYSIVRIERIVNGNRIELSELNKGYRGNFHKLEPLSNSTGEKGFLDFVQGSSSTCNIFKCATYPEYQREGKFEDILEYFAELCNGRDIRHIYAQVDRNNTPMLKAMYKYGFKRTGSIEDLKCFGIDVSNIKV